jgi:hypothetical protein
MLGKGQRTPENIALTGQKDFFYRLVRHEMTMKELIQFLTGNPWLNLIFLVLAIASIVLSVSLYIKSRRTRKPVFNIRTFGLLGRKLRQLDDIVITYHGRQVDNLALTKVAFWNKGTETIRWEDIAANDPIRVEIAENATVLHAEITYVRRAVNGFNISVDNDKRVVMIGFDYADRNDGIVVDIYHTSQLPGAVHVLGTVKGAPSLTKGIFEENDLLFAFFNQTLGRVVPRGKRKGAKSWLVILLSSFPLMPFMMVITLIEAVRRFVSVVPKEYKLAGNE